MPRERHKSMGFDPGSSSWKISVLDDGGILAREKAETMLISQDPLRICRIVDRHKEDLEAIAAPSGHGLPVTMVNKVTDDDLSLMTLKPGGTSIVGLTRAIFSLKEISEEIGAKCFILPSVKHMPTVPRWRKINRVDLGTADKLCSAAFAIQRLSEEKSLDYEQLSFVLGEVGHAFYSMVCVKEGEIVDGVGGTTASYGTQATGAIDAELAHIWNFPDKKGVYTGGLVHVAGMSIEEIEEKLPEKLSKRGQLAINRLAESFASDAVAISSRNEVNEFVLSSSFGPRIYSLLRDAILRVGLKPIGDFKDEWSASTGAAYLVNGLIGGRYEGLSKRLRLKEARGSVMEDIYLSGGSMLTTS